MLVFVDKKTEPKSNVWKIIDIYPPCSAGVQAALGLRFLQRTGSSTYRSAVSARHLRLLSVCKHNPGHNPETPDTPYLQTLDGPFFGCIETKFCK